MTARVASSSVVRRARRTPALVGAGTVALSVLVFGAGGCAENEHPPPADFSRPARPGTSSTGIPTPAPRPGGCGNEEIQALVELPRLYFVLDRSGSMVEALPGQTRSKWQAMRSALASLLRTIGHRVEYGAGIFPGVAGTCDPGRPLFPFSPGDALGSVPPSLNGPILQNLLDRLGAIEPGGGTPIASSLAVLGAGLGDSSARTAIVLATDGAPNCNAAVSCEPESCIPDIEGATFDELVCGAELSCCDPDVIGRGAESNCVDDAASLAAVEALAEAGIDTYVIGMPGAAAYESLLDRLAEAGGTARDAEPRYYAVSDAEQLAEALHEIGTGVAISCDVTLRDVPADASLVNVYYDGDVVPYGESDGWVWDGETSLIFRGAACEALESGQVSQVSITYGCTTVVE